MIKPLRKRHLQIWSLFLVLLPFIIVFGTRAVPKPATGILLQQSSNKWLPLILQSADKVPYTIHLRSSIDTSVLQLQWISKTALTSPSALIYQGYPGQPGGQLLGRIEAMGSYQFPVKTDGAGPLTFVLYDLIRKQNIDTIKFDK